MGLVPLVIVFAIAMLGVEIQRVLTARGHLRGLERRINVAFAGDAPALMSWETLRASTRVINPYPALFAMAIVAAILVGPVIGGLLLIEHRRWIGLVVGVVLDLVLLGVT